jgi:hypothetical protein
MERARQFKSPLPVVAGILLRSRETQRAWRTRLGQQVVRLRADLAQVAKMKEELEEQLAQQKAELARLAKENEQLRRQPLVLPEDPRLPGHGFGPKMIALCVNLACRIGLRAVPDVLEMIFEWLEIDVPIPDWTTVRTWVMRVGVAAQTEPIEAADDWIWLVDHSNQIGPEKVLSVLGIQASKLPPPGQAVKHEDVRVLELQPGTSWKREDMRDAYDQLAERVGPPMQLLADAAVELREGAEMSKKLEKTTLFNDLKHHAANTLRKILGRDKRFEDFNTQLGRTRSVIQQTELGYLTPPSPKPKSRFMNLQATLQWATVMCWLLLSPDAKARREISTQRLEEKLGWLREFREEIPRWLSCQEVVSTACTFINEQRLFRGAARQLRQVLRTLPSQPGAPTNRNSPSRLMMADLHRFVRRSELKLQPGQRLLLSTEILESSFGLFKQREGQHSKGGFTSLLAAYGCLLRGRATPETIRRDFERVSVKEMRKWVTDKLGKTFGSKRRAVFEEFRLAQ